MLTANLARSRTHEDSITPLFIDASERQYRETAEELIQIFEAHLGEPKGDLEDTIDQLTIADTDYKVVQGLAKLLKDECEFETVAPVEHMRFVSDCSRRQMSRIRLFASPPSVRIRRS